MTIRDVLHQAVSLLRRDDRVRAVTIAREELHSYQIRLIRDATIARGFRTSGRRWIVEEGAGSEYTGWSHWSNFLGFSIDSAMADDWQIRTEES